MCHFYWVKAFNYSSSKYRLWRVGVKWNTPHIQVGFIHKLSFYREFVEDQNNSYRRKVLLLFFWFLFLVFFTTRRGGPGLYFIALSDWIIQIIYNNGHGLSRKINMLKCAYSKCIYNIKYICRYVCIHNILYVYMKRKIKSRPLLKVFYVLERTKVFFIV